MFENRILLLTLQILVSFSDSHKLQNKQPWSCKSIEQGPFTEGVKQHSGIHQPLSVQAQIQSISAVPKYTVIPGEIKPFNWESIVTNPTAHSAYDNNPNTYNPSVYENTIRKYDSMANNPNVVNNYFIIPQENYKRKETDSRNRKYQTNINRNKSEKKRRKKERTTNNYDERENTRRQYRHNNEYRSKKIDDELIEVTSRNNERKRKRKESYQILNDDLDEPIEIENLGKKERDRGTRSSQSANKNEVPYISVNDKKSQDLSEKEKSINFSENLTTEDSSNGNPKYLDEEHRHTRNLKSASTAEYKTKYTNPQEEYNKYLQNIMNGNFSTDPYYYMNEMFPYNFDSFYKTAQTGESTKMKNKASNKHKNPKMSNRNTKSSNKERNKNDECNTVIELSPNVYESIPITISTGKKAAPKDIYLNLKIKKNNSPSNDGSIKTDSNNKHEDEHYEFLNDIDKESQNKPLSISLYAPIEDDDLEYYPDFTLLNGAYLTSSEEEELIEFKKNSHYFQNEWDYYADKVKSYTGQNNKKRSYTKANSDNFRSRPGLETKIANKKEYQENDKLNSNINNNVETIYAPSRVKSYSQPEKNTNSEEDQKNFSFKEGDTTIVLSRSID